MNEDRFWMVWIEGREGPTKKHETFDDARREAERLLALPQNYGRKAYVLHPDCYGIVEPPPITWLYPERQGCPDY